MSELTKYVVLTDQSNRGEINDELVKAGFDTLSNRGRCGFYAIILNQNGAGTVKDCFNLVEADAADAKVLHPSDILNGGAQKLDGAKVEELRFFLCTNRMHVVFQPDRIRTLWQNEKADETTDFDTEYFVNHADYIEITASDVAYIRDNAEKAKELGMVLRKVKDGDEVILTSGILSEAVEDNDCSQEHVAGHRYCRKAEAKPEAPNFCHQCSKRIAPKDSKFCRMCAAELK